MKEFDKLYYIAKILRKNCPADRVRTSEQAIKFLKSELEEVREAIEQGNKEHISEELGDLLWNVLFLMHIESKNKGFTIERSLDKICNKLQFRHPHVFENPREVSIEEAEKIWQEQKKKEREMNIEH